MEPEPQDSKYQAFISYSRRTDGELIAPALQRGLQGFAKPWYRLRALRVFRDDDNLSANPAIWPSVQEALEASEHFILLASPESAQSDWVRQELEHWLASHDARKLLLVQTDGAEISWDATLADFAAAGNDAVPDALRGVFSDEPRYVDLRWAREHDQISLANPRFRDAVADIAAPLRGVPKDEIVGEHVRQHRRARRTAIAGASGLAVLTAVAVVFGVLALVSRQQVVDREQENNSVLLATASRSTSSTNQPLALQLGLEAHEASDTSAAEVAIREATTQPQPLAELATGIDRQEFASFSPDGGSIASIGRDGVLRITDAEGGRGQTPVEYPEAGTGANTVRYSPDGSQLAVAVGDGTVRLWTVADGPAGEPLVLKAHDGSVNSAEFSPDGRSLVTAGADGTVRVWNLQRPQAPAAVRRSNGSGAFLFATFSPDGRTIAAAAESGGVRLWPTNRPGASPRILEGAPDDGQLTSLAFSRTGKLLAVAGIGSLRVWTLRADEPGSISLPGHLGPVESVAFSPDGGTLLTGSRDRSARLWNLDAPTQQSVVALRGHRGDVNWAEFSPGGDRILTTGSDGRVLLWEADGYPGQRVARWRDNTSLVTSVALDPEQGRVASAGFEGPIFVRAVDSARLAPPQVLDGHEEVATALAFDSSGQRLVSASRDSTVRVWDLSADGSREARVLRGHSVPLQGVAISASGERVVSGGSGGEVFVWDLAMGGDVEPLRLPAGDEVAWDVAISPDGRLVAAGGFDRIVRVWDLDNPTTLENPMLFLGAQDDVFGVDFSPDGRRLAAASENGIVYLWDVDPAGSAVPEELDGHINGVNAVEFISGGQQIFTTSSDGTARIWDVGSGQRRPPLVLRPRPAGTPIFAGTATPDGSLLAFGGEDVQVRDCVACVDDFDGTLELAALPDIGLLDEADRRRAFGG